MKINVKELILFGILGGFIAAFQFALSFIPNIEVVSLFIIVFSLIYKKKTLYIVYTYVAIMGIMYGFGLWWLGYAIIWPLLSVITFTFINFFMEKYLALAIYSGIFGLSFGLFFAIPYVIFSGVNAGIAYWAAGLQFDLIHGIGNYFIMIILGKKIYNLLNMLNHKYFFTYI